jgi:HK97 gp10 family phage protein
MASWDIYADNFDFLDMDFDDAAERALNEAVGVLEGTMRSAAAAAVKHDGESAMVNSIKGSKPKKVAATDCWIVNVGPRGYSSTKTYHGKRKGGKSKQTYKVSNALKAIWKEYGIPGHQSPQPFMQKATNQAQARVERIIEDAFNKEFEKYEL